MTNPPPAPDLPLYLPFDADAGADQPTALGGPRQIAYLGLAFTRAEFTAYVDSLDFGGEPPLWLVLHHTAVPSATWAPYPSGMIWDANEVGMSLAAKREKRLRQLRGIFDYYEDRYGWLAGPHLWADDLFIYIGSPLTSEGVHAAGGNAIVFDNRRRYSLGLEVIGYYERRPWPEPVMQNVAHAVAVLQRKLGTFQLVSGRGPGYISEHRHYNKPECPGGAVRAAHYLPRFTQAAAALRPTEKPMPTRVIGVRPSVSLAQFRAWLYAHRAPLGEHFDTITFRVYELASWLDIDPAFVAAIWAHETSQVAGVIGSSDLYRKSNNAGAIKAYGRWPKTSHNGAEFNVYESPQTGLFWLVGHLKEFYGHQGLYDVETIIPAYAPASDRNKPASYIAAVLRDMAAMRAIKA